MKQNRRAFLRNSVLAGGALSFGGFASSAEFGPRGQVEESSSGALLRQQFRSPPKTYRPIARWWWPGDLVTEQELRREIEVLDKAGFGGAEIQPFYKGFDPKAFSEAQMQQINSFATPSFFGHVGVAVDEARKHGMFIDYTFGSGWPFGKLDWFRHTSHYAKRYSAPVLRIVKNIFLGL